MKTHLLRMAFLLALVPLLFFPQPANAASPSFKIVQWGDSLAAIAASYGTTVDAIARANALPNPNFIWAGQRLVIPSSSSPQPLPATGSVYIVRPGDTLFSIAGRAGTSVSALQRANGLANPNFIYSGQRLNLTSAIGAIVNVPAPAPSSPATNPASSGKWIDVSLSKQRITAYEGNVAVRSALVSTGVARTPTPVGTYKIYMRYKSQNMSGGSKASNDYYYLPNVPNVQYFFEAYALHGTYWHRNFGTPMSRGCVNLTLADAEWFWNWASMGTPVVVHN